MLNKTAVIVCGYSELSLTASSALLRYGYGPSFLGVENSLLKFNLSKDIIFKTDIEAKLPIFSSYRQLNLDSILSPEEMNINFIGFNFKNINQYNTLSCYYNVITVRVFSQYKFYPYDNQYSKLDNFKTDFIIINEDHVKENDYDKEIYYLKKRYPCYDRLWEE